MIKAAVIGVGAIGHNHARIYHDLPTARLVAVADVDKERVTQVEQRYHVRAYQNYHELLEKERPEIVSVAVPTWLHYEVALDVIAAGVHLLIEKPIAGSLAQGQAIVDAAHQQGVWLAVGHVERFNPAIRALKAHLDAGELGHTFHLHARRMGPFPARVHDVGVVVDLAPHEIDVMRYLTSAEVTRVYAEVEQRVHERHEDGLVGVLHWSNSAIGVLDINWLTPTKIRELAVTGERGMFVVNYLSQDLFFYENREAEDVWEPLGILRGVGEGNMVRWWVEKREPLWVELESFVETVSEGRPPLVNGEDGLRALEVAEALIVSGRERRVIHLNSSGNE
ncbi:MAG TPA: Gfo/Idh/MocA family oxidoreductase [Anaerolineae bacterium]|nr:Gfo/Idh/MocA family oxidoreductase [Anaerolineae bacterium]